jgi:16S rRNA (cytosine967-C5)-methyltransferase
VTGRPVTGDARQAAFDVLRAVDENDAYANLVLPRLLRERSVVGRDAALATELCYGTLRWLGSLDAVLGRCATRGIAELDPPVRAALRLGAYQLLHTRIPPHAAVDSTVQLVRGATGERAVGFTNAVLRRVAGQDWPGWLAELSRDLPAEADRLALATGAPAWVVRAFADALGGDLAEAAAALAADRPVVHLAAVPGRISRSELLAAAGDGAVAGPLSPQAVRLAAGGDPAAIAAVRDRRAVVQDEGSQLAALALARAPVTGPGSGRWLDMCAGPGGKAALLAGFADQAGDRLIAADRNPGRARLVARVLGPAGAVVTADGTAPPWPAASFDRVLLDAPCTGLGALRRRPEARWRRSPADVARLTQLQRALLAAALQAVRPGGVVGYVTCSPHLAETRLVVEAGRDGLDRLDVRELLPEVADAGEGPELQLWPHRHGTDAMFIAILRRRFR